ncbi:MAG: DUF5658 family protein [Clostridium sp.]
MNLKLLLIYIFNINDLVCTLFLLSMGFEEANPLMKNIVSNEKVIIIIKVFIIGMILIFISKFIKKDYKLAKVATNVALLAYVLVTVLHIYYIYL